MKSEIDKFVKEYGNFPDHIDREIFKLELERLIFFAKKEALDELLKYKLKSQYK